ncbi:MAG: hypothetical protein MUC49_14730 [Raineya sp.]|jgi:hypothetical protein|nr:hypothetical protein [Raineya sp.]
MKKRHIKKVIGFCIIVVCAYFFVVIYKKSKRKNEDSEENALGKVFIEEKQEYVEIGGQEILLIYTPFFPPYNEKGKTNFKNFTDNKKGVYFIRKQDTNEILYIGHSKSDLYKTAYRHFQSWEDKKQYRVTYPKRKYEIAFAVTNPNLDDNKIVEIEKYFILLLNPKDNAMKYESYTNEFDFDGNATPPDESILQLWKDNQEEAPF